MRDLKQNFTDLQKSFDTQLRLLVHHWANEMPYPGSCVKTVIAVLKELGYNTIAFETDNNVFDVLQNLTLLAKLGYGVREIKSHDEVQELANKNIGNKIYVAGLSLFAICRLFGLHHFAIVGRNLNYKGIPAIYGGGLNKPMLKKGWDLSNAQIHFNWGLKEVKGGSKKLGIPEKIYKIPDPKTQTKYFEYSLR